MAAATITFDAHEILDLGEGLFVSARVVAEEAKRATERSAILVQNAAKVNIQQQKAIDTGQLLNSIARQVEPFEARIGSNKQYARNVEEGRAAGAAMPPGDSLDGWLRRHNIPLEASFPIRRAIQDRGIRPRPYLLPALETNRTAINREYQAAGMRIAERVTEA